MVYYVYIMYSEKCNQYYVGHSDNVDRKLDEHNSGKGGKYTIRWKPWELVYSGTYESKSLVVNRELEIENKKSTKYIEGLIEQKNQDDIGSTD